jgi:hypothetical protein
MRAAVLLLGAALLVGACVAAVLGPAPVACELGGIGVLILIGTLFERRFYRPIEGPPPGPEWQLTAERFRDPTSGRVVAVWFNPRTGQRRYGQNGGAGEAG